MRSLAILIVILTIPCCCVSCNRNLSAAEKTALMQAKDKRQLAKVLKHWSHFYRLRADGASTGYFACFILAGVCSAAAAYAAKANFLKKWPHREDFTSGLAAFAALITIIAGAVDFGGRREANWQAWTKVNQLIVELDDQKEPDTDSIRAQLRNILGVRNEGREGGSTPASQSQVHDGDVARVGRTLPPAASPKQGGTKGN